MSMSSELERRLQYGPGMRVQRLAEAAFLIAAFFFADVRLAYVTFGLTVLQTLSPRLAVVALLVAVFVPSAKEHKLGDLYFDLAGSRGACAISVIVQAAGIALIRAEHEVAGYLILTMPTASFVLAPTVGFCCGCAVYVAAREVLAKVGLVKRYADGACDIEIES